MYRVWNSPSPEEIAKHNLVAVPAGPTRKLMKSGAAFHLRMGRDFDLDHPGFLYMPADDLAVWAEQILGK